MLQKRVLWSLTRYFGLLTLLFTAILLIPSISEGIFATPQPLADQLKYLMEPLPELWLIILPTVFMLAVLIAFSRLGFTGDLKIWRAAGTSGWPFALATALFGIFLGGLMTGPLWQFTQPEDADYAAAAPSHYVAPDGSSWTRLAHPIGQNEIVLYGDENGVLQAQIISAPNRRELLLGPGWIAQAGAITTFQTMNLTRHPDHNLRSPDQGANRNSLAYRLSYPVLLVGLGLLMLPLAMSIDGHRLTLVKIVAGCLLALNALFILLMTDAMAKAGFWSELLFFPARALVVLAIGLLALLLVEERAA